ncbi:hypothetical protein Bmyc01_49610 [Bacillus mycoides]|nr:hypothetical protein Bmyc01_49610 [Bacillus mycoides]
MKYFVFEDDELIGGCEETIYVFEQTKKKITTTALMIWRSLQYNAYSLNGEINIGIGIKEKM